MGVIFSKTPKGHEEITSKAGGLTPRVRRTLIFVDGKRTVDELRSMLLSDDLQHTLGMLEEEGYIELTTGSPSPAKAPQPEQRLPSITAFRAMPESADPIELQQARNFMKNTLTTFIGSLGITALLDGIEAAEGHGGLRALFDDWYYAIVTSREGRREAEALRAKLLKII